MSQGGGTRLSFGEHLDAITTEADRLAAVTGGILEAKVPSCPDWSVRDLLDHLWHVFTFWHAQVAANDPNEPREPGDRTIPEDEDPGEWLLDAAAHLVAALEIAGAESACWNWSGNDFDTAWVARRMALETAVHRYDGELAAGMSTPVEAGLAADGIDERLFVHLRVDLPEEPEATLGGSLCLACSNVDAAWVVEAGGGSLRVREGRGPASACLSGTASQLFLFCWNRLGVGDVELTGDPAVAAAWASLPV